MPQKWWWPLSWPTEASEEEDDKNEEEDEESAIIFSPRTYHFRSRPILSSNGPRHRACSLTDPPNPLPPRKLWPRYADLGSASNRLASFASTFKESHKRTSVPIPRIFEKVSLFYFDAYIPHGAVLKSPLKLGIMNLISTTVIPLNWRKWARRNEASVFAAQFNELRRNRYSYSLSFSLSLPSILVGFNFVIRNGSQLLRMQLPA